MRKLLIFLFPIIYITSCTQTNTTEDHSNGHSGAEIDVEGEKKAFEHLVPKHKKLTASPQKVDKPRVEPSSWWTGMANPVVELIVHDNNIKDHKVSVNQSGVSIKKVTKAENPNYLFVEVNISPSAKTGKFPIVLTKGGDKREYPFELNIRNKGKDRVQGLSSKDVIYLIMPDRFANGDESNDSIEGMNETGINRNKILSRHGGDLQGIIDNLDYLKDLGVTALWLNPVLENDQPYESYHGYATSDHYLVDRRFGTNETYKKLVEEAHKKGIKIVKDIIQNHCGDQHWFIKDLPSADWVHQWDDFTRTTYRAPALLDPYAAEADRTKMVDGWFDHHMPDLNQQNPHLANYLIQNTIWWVEYTGLDGFRIDTYAYPDLAFSKEWMDRLQAEFPNLGIFGETWVHGIPIQNFFIEKTNLPGVTDFQIYYAINDALNNNQGWTSGAAKIYYTLAQDVEYKDPTKNVVFLDNHDLSRFASSVGGDMNKFKSGLAFLFTTRGIPMITYGTELMMEGLGGGFGEGGRRDFPGGWKDDSDNKFTTDARKGKEAEAYNFIKKLLNYRKNNPVLATGKMIQFVPENGIYVYFRYNDNKTVMIIMNTHEEGTEVVTQRYQEKMKGFSKGKDIISDEVLNDINKLKVDGKSTLILELIK